MRRLKKYLVYLMTGGTLLMICGVFPKKSTITAVEEYGISNPIVNSRLNGKCCKWKGIMDFCLQTVALVQNHIVKGMRLLHERHAYLCND